MIGRRKARSGNAPYPHARRRRAPRPARPTLWVVAGLLAAIVWTSGGLGAQVGDRAAIDSAPPPADWKIPPAPVRSPEESMRMMDLQPGFRIELVASEPLVQDPIAFAFDERNRLWVLEWPSYNWPLRGVLPGLEPQPTPASHLVVLTDTDGDGRMDTRTVFASMDFPRGIQLVDGGVLVYALPEVVFLRDTDGDDKADQRELVQGGLPVPVNPHLAPSSPSWTLDNWTYGLQVGDRLRFAGGARTASPSGRLAGQWGMSHDDYGRLFFSYNQDHIRGSLVPTAYATRNPHYAATGGIDVRIGLDNEVWPHAITPGVNRRAQLRDDGRLRVFTANAAPTVYRGDQFPEEFRGNVFVGESAGRLIRRSVLTERDGIITGKNAYAEREFLFSHDERFRPVFSATGPDGALYVADMYRGIIEGHIFLTTFLRNQIVDRGLQQPFHGMGRIYRIVHEGRPLGTAPSVAPGDVAGWVPVLAHANGHWRDMAQRMIVASKSTAVVPAVRALAMAHEDARVRLHGLWTLEGLGAADDALVRARLADASPHLRIAALRIAETRLSDDAMRRAVLAAADDAEVAVRRQVVYTLGASHEADAEEARLRLLRRDIDAPFMVDAFMSGAAGHELQTLDLLTRSPMWAADRPEHRALVTALATAIGNDGRAEGSSALRRLSAEAAGRPAWQREAVLEGVKASSRTTPAATITAAPRDAATAALVEQGRAAFAICAACHQADGRGLPSIAPPLVGSPRVTGPPAALIDIVLQGRDEDPAYPSMSPLAGLPDEQLAAILTYVRQAWGHAAPPISADAVRARRTPAPGRERARGFHEPVQREGPDWLAWTSGQGWRVQSLRRGEVHRRRAQDEAGRMERRPRCALVGGPRTWRAGDRRQGRTPGNREGVRQLRVPRRVEAHRARWHHRHLPAQLSAGAVVGPGEHHQSEDRRLPRVGRALEQQRRQSGQVAARQGRPADRRVEPVARQDGGRTRVGVAQRPADGGRPETRQLFRPLPAPAADGRDRVTDARHRDPLPQHLRARTGRLEGKP